MLALGIHYLCGWSAAMSAPSSEAPEWPPHPDRVYMALAAAYFETRGSHEERAALDWMSDGLPAPAIACSQASTRTLDTYVPVNDSVRARLAADGGRRGRRIQYAIPRDPVVYAVWPDVDATPHAAALESLCRKVTHIGHSSSFVQMWVARAAPPATLLPDERGETQLRVPGRGRLRELDRLFNLDPPQRPRPSVWQRYSRPPLDGTRPVARSHFSDDILVLRSVGRRRFGLESTQLIAQALRAATLKHLDGAAVPEWISGHQADGSASRAPHVAFVPLAHVGHEHADGHIVGAGLVVPLSVASRDVVQDLRPLLQHALHDGGLHIFDGRALDLNLELETRELRAQALRPTTWTSGTPGCCSWASVTPIVLPRYPKRKGDVEALIRTACLQVGLPDPVEVAAASVSRWIGAPHASSFAPFLDRKTGSRRFHVHAALTFAVPVIGPVLLGAGRYAGYGLCRPLEPER